MAVLCTLRWRSTCAMLESDAPRRSISVASVWRSRCAPNCGRPARTQACRTSALTSPLPNPVSGANRRKQRERADTRGRSQRRDDELGVTDRARATGPYDEPGHVLGGQALEAELARGKLRRQVFVRCRPIQQQAARREPSLPDQILAIQVDQAIDGATHEPRRLRDNVQPPQIREHPRDRVRGNSVHAASPPPASQELLGPLRRELARREPALLEPAAHVRYEAHLKDRRPGLITEPTHIGVD